MGAYLLLDVVEGVGRVDGEADQNDVRVGVGKGTETVIVLLASSIPEGQFDVLSVDLDIGHIVLENGGDVNLRNGASATVHAWLGVAGHSAPCYARCGMVRAIARQQAAVPRRQGNVGGGGLSECRVSGRRGAGWGEVAGKKDGEGGRDGSPGVRVMLSYLGESTLAEDTARLLAPGKRGVGGWSDDDDGNGAGRNADEGRMATIAMNLAGDGLRVARQQVGWPGAARPRGGEKASEREAEREQLLTSAGRFYRTHRRRQ